MAEQEQEASQGAETKRPGDGGELQTDSSEAERVPPDDRRREAPPGGHQGKLGVGLLQVGRPAPLVTGVHKNTNRKGERCENDWEGECQEWWRRPGGASRPEDNHYLKSNWRDCAHYYPEVQGQDQQRW